MTDYQMEEIYGLVEDAFKGGEDRVPLQAFPFQMTADNLMRHADDPNAPFWQMLKEGSDAFTVAGVPPKVAVCNQRYVFNAPQDQYSVCPNVIDPLAGHPRS
jgi:murein L,D-transpeptidase YafK